MFSLFTPLCNFYCALEARVAAPPTAMFATGSLLGGRLRDVKQRGGAFAQNMLIRGPAVAR